MPAKFRVIVTRRPKYAYRKRDAPTKRRHLLAPLKPWGGRCFRGEASDGVMFL
jgi:hypothetical protein